VLVEKMTSVIGIPYAFVSFCLWLYYKQKDQKQIMETLEVKETSTPVKKDSCCLKCQNNNKSLGQGCSKRINNLVERNDENRNKYYDLELMQLDVLSDFILREYHQYYYDCQPALSALLQQTTAHLVPNEVDLLRLNVLFSNLDSELREHLLVEERVLFPHIKNLVIAKKNFTFPSTLTVKNIVAPISVMEAEHKSIEAILVEIAAVTENFTAPETACENIKKLFRDLKALNDNLEQHFYIENNIFYKRAVILEGELVK
jgi:regulator of cell morphogenesis and NO signaling